MGDVDFGRYEVLTFDCYGTLIDWETGIVDAFRAVLAPRGIEPPADELLEAYGQAEADAEDGPYLRYREVLARSMAAVCARYGVDPTAAEGEAFAQSIGAWPAFPDSRAALERLTRRFRLGVITNCDDDLFALSNRRLGVRFDWVVTAEQVGSYKPSTANFLHAFDRIGVPRERILHVAQSLFHDHVPAKRLGLTTVWVNRRHDRPGFGATPPADAHPDLTVPDMATLASLGVPEPSGTAPADVAGQQS